MDNDSQECLLPARSTTHPLTDTLTQTYSSASQSGLQATAAALRERLKALDGKLQSRLKARQISKADDAHLTGIQGESIADLETLHRALDAHARSVDSLISGVAYGVDASIASLEFYTTARELDAAQGEIDASVECAGARLNTRTGRERTGKRSSPSRAKGGGLGLSSAGALSVSRALW